MREKQERMARLGLERLEGRCVPAVYTWEGDVSSNWTDPNNWEGATVPVSSDTAKLDTIAMGNNMPTIPNATGVVVKELLATPNFAGKTLTVLGTLTTQDGTWEAGTLRAASSWLHVRGLASTGDFKWRGGTLDLANVYVSGGGRFHNQKDATDWRITNFRVGYDPSLIVSAGSWYVSAEGPDDRLTANITINTDVNRFVHISSSGAVWLQHTVDSHLKGGINSVSLGVDSAILCEGVIHRRVVDSGERVLMIGLPIELNGAGARIEMDELGGSDEASFWIADALGGRDSLVVNNGTVNLDWGRLEFSDNFDLNGGTLSVYGHSRLVGTFYHFGGTILFDSLLDFGHLYVDGNFYQIGGTIRMAVDTTGTIPLSNALEVIGGEFGLTGGELAVRISADAGDFQAFDLFTFTTLANPTFDFEAITYTGTPCSRTIDFDNDSYTLIINVPV